LSSDPAGSEGDVFFNTTEKALKIHNGVTWVLLAKNTDPTPFYMHTHTYDGDVHTIDITNPVTFLETNTEAITSESLPNINSYDGGNATSEVSDPSSLNLTLLDGGIV
jgi:hypothetical protein